MEVGRVRWSSRLLIEGGSTNGDPAPWEAAGGVGDVGHGPARAAKTPAEAGVSWNRPEGWVPDGVAQRWAVYGPIPTGGSTVVSDGLHRAAFHGFLAGGFFFGARRLLHDVGVTAVIPTCEILRGGFAAQVAVDALIVDEVFARDVFGIPVCNVSHI